MKDITFCIAIIAFSYSSCDEKSNKKAHSNIKAQIDMKEPVATKVEKQLKKHGIIRIDSYFWMNQRDSKEVLAYIKKENQYADGYFKTLNASIKEIIAEFNKNIDPNTEDAPYWLNEQTFQATSSKDADYQKIFKLVDGKKELFFDQNERAKQSKFYGFGGFDLSPNNQLISVSEDFLGRNKWRISFRKADSEEWLKDKLENTGGDMEWSKDNKTIYYITRDSITLRDNKVFAHVIGSAQKSDKLIYEEKDEQFSVFIGLTSSKKYLKIGSGSSTTSETLLIDRSDANFKLIKTLSRKKDHIYDIEDHPNGWYVLSNMQAANKKLVFLKNLKDDFSKALEIIPHNQTRLIEAFSITKTHFITYEKANANNEIRFAKLETNSKQEIIKFDEECVNVEIVDLKGFESSLFQFSFSSLTTPYCVYEFNMDTQKRTKVFERKILNTRFRSSDYQSKRLYVTATDGTEIPVSLVYKKGIDLKKAPLLEYGYGAYGVSETTHFSGTRLTLLDRGFVYAIAHVRGGRDLGEAWYLGGKWLNKKNTFTDFIDVAKQLGNLGYCDPKRVFAEGGSAGGLLMGAIANMAPEIYRGIIADVPFVDVVTTMLDTRIPLTTGEYEEWGNPEEKTYFDYMLSYSPYDNVKKQNYPAMFVGTGYHDSQVQYWEPLKWVAKLRSMKTDNHVLIFDCNMDAGHGGGSGRESMYLKVAKQFAFLIDINAKVEK